MKTSKLDDDKILTRTEATEKHYQTVYEGLERRAREHAVKIGSPIPDGVEVDPDLVIDAFLEHRVNLTNNSDRQYKAAIIQNLTKLDHPMAVDRWHKMARFVGISYPDTDFHKHFERAPHEKEKWKKKYDEMLAERKARQDQNQRLRNKKNTAGQKAKKLPLTDIEVLLTALKASKSKYAADTALWFTCASYVGLRPSEWATVEMETREIKGKEQFVLVVQNGKFSNDRSFSKTRTIVLDGMNEIQLNHLRFHIESAHAEQARGQFAAWFEACRNVIKLMSRSLWKDRRTFPTLYTARHLFAANAKNKLTRKEVAALLGHGSELTAGKHYARRSASTGGLDVSPSEADMDALTVRNGITSQEPKTSEWLENKKASLGQKGDDSKITAKTTNS